MVTGDLNLIEVQVVAQYRIADLNRYLFHADNPGIDFQHTDHDLKLRAHRPHRPGYPDGRTILDQWETSITITAIQLRETKPPAPVQGAFDDVLRARKERDIRINSALACESKVLQEARGQAEQIMQQAHAYAALLPTLIIFGKVFYKADELEYALALRFGEVSAVSTDPACT